MRLDGLETAAGAGSPLRRIDPRWKLLGTLTFVIFVVLTPVGAWTLLGTAGLVLAFVVGLARIPAELLLWRWLAFAPLVIFLAAMIAPGHPARAQLPVLAIAFFLLAKNSLAFLAVILLSSVTSFPQLLHALGRLRVPPVLVATLHFMYRYLFVLRDQLERMVNARRSRTFSRTGRLDWGLLTGLIGVLFLRSLERGERVHAAMLARGWDGTLRSLEGPES
jgi:cobalt/nickel transport system permease protein